MSATISAPAAPAADGRSLRRFTACCLLGYITIHAFESPVRYLLYRAGLSPAILLRDGLLIAPLLLICLRDVLANRLAPAVWLFGLFAGIAFAVGTVNFGVLAVPALGAKMLLGCLLGWIAGGSLIGTTRGVSGVFLALWLVSVAGVLLEKYVVTFPWVGLHAMIGGVDVEISRDWQITDAFHRRVGGLTRVSTTAAGLIPILGLVAIARMKSFVARHLILLITAGGVFLTTQKGALLAVCLVWCVLVVPRQARVPVQVVAALLAVVADVMLPIVTHGMTLAGGSGDSYSSASFVNRIMITWPGTWNWIARREIFPFGVGLGGVGEAQRLVGSVAFHYPDNFFLFLLASFGLVSVGFLGVIVVAILRALRLPAPIAGCALSVLTFILFYGSVVSIIEDPIEALFLGAALGVLLSLKQEVTEGLLC